MYDHLGTKCAPKIKMSVEAYVDEDQELYADVLVDIFAKSRVGIFELLRSELAVLAAAFTNYMREKMQHDGQNSGDAVDMYQVPQNIIHHIAAIVSSTCVAQQTAVAMGALRHEMAKAVKLIQWHSLINDVLEAVVVCHSITYFIDHVKEFDDDMLAEYCNAMSISEATGKEARRFMQNNTMPREIMFRKLSRFVVRTLSNIELPL